MCETCVPLASAKPKQAQLTHLCIFNPFFSQKWKKSNKECHHLLAICTEYDLHTVQPDLIYYTWRGRMFIYVCVSEWGQLSNKEGEKKQQQHCSVSLGSVGQRSSLVFTVKHSIPGLREDDQRFSAAPRRPASRSADISLFFPTRLYFLNNNTDTWHGEEIESQEMWTREAQTGNLVSVWVRSSENCVT